MTKKAENSNTPLQPSLDIAGVSSSNCDKGWHDGSCCCNCKHHYEDFYHALLSQNQKMLKVVFAQLIKGGFALSHLKVNNQEHTPTGVNMECVKCTSEGSSIIAANVRNYTPLTSMKNKVV